MKRKGFLEMIGMSGEAWRQRKSRGQLPVFEMEEAADSDSDDPMSSPFSMDYALQMIVALKLEAVGVSIEAARAAVVAEKGIPAAFRTAFRRLRGNAEGDSAQFVFATLAMTDGRTFALLDAVGIAKDRNLWAANVRCTSGFGRKFLDDRSLGKFEQSVLHLRAFSIDAALKDVLVRARNSGLLARVEMWLDGDDDAFERKIVAGE